jgi:O-antigen/teichoic acid export membrane protein
MLIDTLVLTIIVVAINLLFGPAAAGQYFLMRRVLDLPVGFAAKTFSDAFHGKAAELARIDPPALRRLMIRLGCGLAVVAGVAFLPLVIIGPALFGFIFGGEWREAGLLAAVMAPALVASLAASPVARVFLITQRPALRYIYSISYLLSVCACLLIAHFDGWSLIGTVAALSAATTISYIIYFATAYYAACHVQPPDGG